MDNRSGPSLDLSPKHFIILFVVTLGLILVAIILFAWQTELRGNQQAFSEATLYVMQDYVYGGLMLLGVYVFGIKVAKLSWRDIGFVKCDMDWIIRAVLLGVMVYGARIWSDALSLTTLDARRSLEPGVTDLAILKEAPQVTEYALVFAVAVLTPFATEIVQRGILFAWLRRNFNFLMSAIASAVVFGGLHIQVTRYAQVLIFGILAAYLYEKSRSLWPSIAYHMTVNCAYLLSTLT
jgi:membrane protease YdiL (CAAX protease family)